MAELDNYRVYYYSTPRYSWDVRIDLYMDVTPVGSVFFIKAGNPVPGRIRFASTSCARARSG